MALPPGRQPVAPAPGAAAPALHSVPADAAYAALRGGHDDDTMVLPRRVAEAAYELLRVLRAYDAADVYDVLDRALGRRPRPQRPEPCEICLVAVGEGLTHAADCDSAEAVRVRTAPVPKLCTD